MKLTVLSAAAITLASPALAASCQRFDQFGSWHYSIEASGVPNIPGTCGGLWDNMKRFAACPIGIVAECSTLNDGRLYWGFTVGKGCNGG